MADTGPVHQVLHGYSDGHSLLASSREVSKASARLMLAMSDMSGTSMLPGFKSYLTGYPLAEDGLFAIARTWYAPEMDRPGCVWTHTLLFSCDQLRRIRDPLPAMHLFRRPRGPEVCREGYGEPIDAGEVLSGTQPLPLHGFPSVIEQLLQVLYSSRTAPVLLVADDSQVFEPLVTSIWAQQWPSLRAAFAFCTGSLAGREIGGKPLDLQVVPSEGASSIHRSAADSVLVRCSSRSDASPGLAWAHWLANDLMSPGHTGFRDRLWEAAAYLGAERDMFPLAATLAAWCVGASDRQDAPALLSFVSEHVASAPYQGRAAEVLVETALSSSDRKVFGVGRLELLAGLAERESALAAADVAPGTGVAATRYAERRPGEAIQLLAKLLRTELSLVGETIMQSLLRAIAAKPPPEVFAELRDALPLLVVMNPDLYRRPETWQGTERQCCEVLEKLAACEVSSSEFRYRTALAIVEAGQDRLARDVVRHLGTEALRAVLDWFDASHLMDPRSLAPCWREVLAANASVSTAWLLGRKEPPELGTLAVISSYIAPDASELVGVTPDLWVRAWERRDQSAPPNVVDRTATFLLALSLHSSVPSYGELAASVFDRVHGATMDSRLEEDTWLWLHRELPDIGFFRSWDRAERLRRGVAARFARGIWPVDKFPQLVRGLEDWHFLLKSSKKVKKGKRFLRELLHRAKHGTVALSREKLRRLQSAIG